MISAMCFHSKVHRQVHIKPGWNHSLQTLLHKKLHIEITWLKVNINNLSTPPTTITRLLLLCLKERSWPTPNTRLLRNTQKEWLEASMHDVGVCQCKSGCALLSLVLVNVCSRRSSKKEPILLSEMSKLSWSALQLCELKGWCQTLANKTEC